MWLYRVPTQMSWIISRTFQDIFELISRTFLPKNAGGISNFKEMEQQSSFQIPINLSFLKFINFQDFPRHFARFQDFPESGNPATIITAWNDFVGIISILIMSRPWLRDHYNGNFIIFKQTYHLIFTLKFPDFSWFFPDLFDRLSLTNQLQLSQIAFRKEMVIINKTSISFLEISHTSKWQEIFPWLFPDRLQK